MYSLAFLFRITQSNQTFVLCGIKFCPKLNFVRNYIVWNYIVRNYIVQNYIVQNYIVLNYIIQNDIVWNYIVSGIMSCLELHCVRNYVMSEITLIIYKNNKLFFPFFPFLSFLAFLVFFFYFLAPFTY